MTHGQRALILGRFQPPHLGHMHAIAFASKNYERVIVLIGSAQAAYTSSNPFTAGERIEMLADALAEADITNVGVHTVADINRHAQWVAHVRAHVPRFDVVVTNNPLTKLLFQDAGHTVVEVELLDRQRYSGRRLRRQILAGKDVSQDVPPAVLRHLQRLDARARLAAAAEDAPHD